MLNVIKDDKKKEVDRDRSINDNFKPILDLMDNEVKEFTRLALTKIPDYFFIIPASSTGKYHPKYALGEGGLVRHTLACCFIALELFRNTSIQTFTKHEQDLILSSLILHDTFKCGNNGCNYTVIEHPILASNFVLDLEQNILKREDIVFISLAISSHMGQWVNDKKGNKVLDEPSTKYQHFVHLCDYLASRKILEINIE